MKELNFSLDLDEIPVKLTRKGKTEQYVLRALDGAQRDAHLNDSTKRVKMLGDKHVIGNFKGMQADLVARSLYTVPDNERLTLEQVQEFPATVIEALYDAARELSGLDDEEEDDDNEEGNGDS